MLTRCGRRSTTSSGCACVDRLFRGKTVAGELPGLPEHGPGPIARNARVRYSLGGCSTDAIPLDVEVRDLACYETAYGLGSAQ